MGLFCILAAYFFAARRYASAVYGVITLCVSVRPSQVGVLQRWLNLGSHKQRRTIAQGLKYSDAKNLGEIPTGLPPTGAPNRGGVGSNGDFRPTSRYISVTVQDEIYCSYYRMLIGTRMCSIDWCYFQDLERP